MKFLLVIRVITITVIYLLLKKFDPAITDPLSTFATILHELGHSVGAFVSGGNSLGYTLTEDSTHIFACTKGGSAWMTVFGGNLFTLGGAWLFVWLGRNGERQFAPILILLGILMFATTALFSIITLPVEFDASRRALAWLDTSRIATSFEHSKAKDALWWAAMTYVVAAISAITTLFYYVMIYLNRR